MNLALRPARLAVVPAVALARVEVFNSFAAAEPYWRALARNGALATAYQRFELLALWQRHLGAAEGVSPLIMVGFDAAGEPLVLLPFGVRPRAGLRIAQFLGGKHVNFNMGLWRRGFARAGHPDVIRQILPALDGKADALLLCNQPREWQGTANPLAQWPHRPSPSMGHSGALAADFDALLRERTNSAARKKMRKKSEALVAGGAVKFSRAMDV